MSNTAIALCALFVKYPNQIIHIFFDYAVYNI